MQPRHRLLRLLADGRLHSGEALGQTLGVGRTAVWKQVRALRAAGLEIHAARGRGYRLTEPIELLARERILAAMAPAARRRLHAIEVLAEVDSTNAHLRAGTFGDAPLVKACFAEAQTAGRGRRGRPWASPFAANLYFSVLWPFACTAGALQGLGLAVGASVAEALEESGVPGVGLKWPNDLQLEGRKLGGILLETGGKQGAPPHVVCGVGINVAMPLHAASTISQPWCDLRAALGTPAPRNRLAGRILSAVLEALERFGEEGFAPFLGAWTRRDVVCGRQVMLHTEGSTDTAGRAEGVDDSGALLLRVRGRTRRILSGDISLSVMP